MNVKLRSLVAATLAGSFMMGFGANAVADSTDDIVNALIAKGVLTEEEGALLQKGREGEKEAAEKKKKSAVSGKVKNGISWESGDGENSIAVAGRIQLDYRTYDSDDNKNNTTEDFDVRRAYFGVSGKLAKYYDYKVVANFAEADSTSTQKSNQLDEAYFGINWWKEASFRFGQFKMPFSLEEQTSSRFIDFQERSLANKLIPGKEIGAMLHGEPVKGMFYALALSTGEGRSNVEAKTDEGNDVIGRVGYNFAELTENKDNVYHVAAAYSNGTQSKTMAVASNSESKGYGVSIGTLAADTKRTRTGLEGAAAFGPVKLQSEWIRATYDHVTAGDLDVDSWYASASWMITGEKYASSYKGGKFDRISPIKDFDPKTLSGGAWEVGVRYSDFDGKDFRDAAVLAATAPAQVDAWTVGLKFIPTPNTRLMLNYVDSSFDKDIVSGTGQAKDEKAITMRAQMDF
jgi:phosphate-selective porin OprO/OprP